eukprot:scaffold118202_cov21-Tisochrysis_lutea.AAC.1
MMQRSVVSTWFMMHRDVGRLALAALVGMNATLLLEGPDFGSRRAATLYQSAHPFLRRVWAEQRPLPRLKVCLAAEIFNTVAPHAHMSFMAMGQAALEGGCMGSSRLLQEGSGLSCSHPGCPSVHLNAGWAPASCAAPYGAMLGTIMGHAERGLSCNIQCTDTTVDPT